MTAWDSAELLPRPVGRPSQKPLVEYKGFLYQAASWKTARRAVAKVEHHAGELFSARGVHRHQSHPAQPGGGTLLQKARELRAVDQGCRLQPGRSCGMLSAGPKLILEIPVKRLE